MTTPSPIEHRFYGDLAPWWPLISPAEEYAEEAAFAADLLAEGGTRTVLELGSGGGHLASHLTGRFAMTLVDISEPMLAVSRELNAGVPHHQGDMRTVRLGETFDAVFIHDAVDYMASEEDLRQAVGTAFAHCRPGGIVVIVPDDVADDFESRTSHSGSDAPDGRGARLLEWCWDPDPSDSWVETHYTFVLRSADGEVEVTHELHRMGLFSRDTWLEVMGDAGLDARAHQEIAAAGEHPRLWFVGRRPL